MGPAQADFISLRYAGLAVTPALDQISGALSGAVDRIELIEGEGQAEIRLLFKTPGARVKSIMMPAGTNSGKEYRLVLDIYSAPSAAKVPAVVLAAATVAAALPPPVPKPASAGVVSAAPVAAVPVVAAATEAIEKPDDVDPAPRRRYAGPSDQPAVDQDERPPQWQRNRTLNCLHGWFPPRPA